MTNPAAAGTAAPAQPGEWVAAPAFLIGHTIWLSLALRLRPPATVPGTSGRRAPGTKAPAKEGYR